MLTAVFTTERSNQIQQDLDKKSLFLSYFPAQITCTTVEKTDWREQAANVQVSFHMASEVSFLVLSLALSVFCENQRFDSVLFDCDSYHDGCYEGGNGRYLL